MRHRSHRFLHLGARALMTAAFGLALALMVSSSPALAHGKHGRDRARHGRHHRVHHRHHHKYYRPPVVHHRHRSEFVRRAVRFAVPHRIYTHSLPHYRSYYRGRSYYRPHRHDHAVYMFPVSTPYGVVYRPHAYCGDRLFVDGVIDLGSVRLGVRLGF
jgi:hypothetical protein